MGIALYRIDGEVRTALAHAVTNADGRCDAPLLDGAGMEAGSYVLEFGVGAYFSALTGAPSPFHSTVVIRFEIAGHPPHFLLLKQAEASLCTQNPGFPEPLCLRASLPVLTGWWRGDFDFAEARRQGLALDGPKALVRAFPGWFQRYMLAGIPPVAKESSA